MQSSSYEYNVRMFGIATDPYTFHIVVFNVCRCAIDINHIGE